MKKIIILIVVSLVLYILWIIGMEQLYAHMLYGGAKLLLSPFGNITPVLKTDLLHPDFCVAVGKEGYCMQLELFGLSILLLVAWFIMRVMTIGTRKVLLHALAILAVFYLLQVLVMCSLALYDWGVIVQQANNAMRQGFAILAIFIILYDSYLYGWNSPK